jgi:peptidoglycan/xylan/chitin deacetylase (PgdA/CDA1 family)
VHTVTHPVLAKLTPEHQAEEISASRHRIESEIGSPINLMSYPEGRAGSFNGTTRQVLADNGIELAFSQYGGFVRPKQFDPYDIQRVPVTLRTSTSMLHAMSAMPRVFARP